MIGSENKGNRAEERMGAKEEEIGKIDLMFEDFYTGIKERGGSWRIKGDKQDQGRVVFLWLL